MNKKKNSPPKNMDRYTEFLGSLDLVTIALAECSLSLDRAEFFRQDVTLSAELQCRAEEVSAESFEISATLNTAITADESESIIGKIEARFLLHFHANTSDRQMVNQFAKSDVRLMVWPYFRELVSNVTARMHIQPIILPVSGHSERLFGTQRRKRGRPGRTG
jgi:preprotein translocase subunit SecB